MIIWKILPTSLEKKRFDMNAEPVAFLQFMQWQIRKVMGSPMISYFTDLHKQDPNRVVEEDMVVMRRPRHFGRTRKRWSSAVNRHRLLVWLYFSFSNAPSLSNPCFKCRFPLVVPASRCLRRRNLRNRQSNGRALRSFHKREQHHHNRRPKPCSCRNHFRFSSFCCWNHCAWIHPMRRITHVQRPHNFSRNS